MLLIGARPAQPAPPQEVAMTEVTRRGIVKCAAALAVGAGMVATGSALGEEPDNTAGARPAQKPADEFLARAKRSPEAFMLSQPEIFALDTDGHSRDLIITSARDKQANPVKVRVPSRSVRIFRADPSVDEFTAQGGLHWRFRDKPGKVKLPKESKSALALGAQRPGQGPIVMVVRDEETVRVYTMTPEGRC